MAATPGDGSRAKRRTVALLRGLLIIAVGGLLVQADAASAATYPLLLLSLFAVSDLALPFVSLAAVRSSRFDIAVATLDLGLVFLGLYLAGSSYALAVSCLFMVLVMALGSQRIHAVAGAVAVGALHAWLTLRGAGPSPDAWRLVLHTVFLCAVGMYYGYLTEPLHRDRRRDAAEEFERRDLEVLLEILEAVSSSLDLKVVTGAIVAGVAKVVPAVRCSILLVDDARHSCQVVASHDVPDLPTLDLDLAKYPEVVRAVQTRSAVIVSDVRSDPLMGAVKQHIQDSNFRSIMVVPITFGDECYGTLCLKTSRPGKPFSRREISLCKAVAGAAANAMKNGLLHQQVREESVGHRAAAEKLARVLEQSPEIIVTTDIDGVVTDVNRAGDRLLGYAKGELIGRHASRVLPPADAELVARVLEERSIINHPCRLTRHDGHTLDAELNLSVLRDEGGDVVGTVWAGRDVSELRSAQRQLVQAEKLSGIGSTIAGVAHELNNPLSILIGMAGLLSERHEGTAIVDDLATIDESARRCQKIVGNLLSFARAHKPEQEYVDLNEVVRRALEFREYALRVDGVEVVSELDPDLPKTMLDRHQIQQVLVNLLVNAQHAVASVTDRPGRIEVRTRWRGPSVFVEVVDNGVGMNDETIGKIFTPFFTTRNPGEGTGLGLAVSYGIVKEHDGRIEVDSRPGDGTTVVVGLPVCGAASPSAEVEPEPAEVESELGPEEPSRILIVDDERMILEVLKRVLEMRGYRVDVAGSGLAATRKIEVQAYDMVLSDMRMPGMDGRELFLWIEANRPELVRRFVFMTGDLLAEEISTFLAEKRLEAIPKPVTLAVLRSTVGRVLARREAPVGVA